jgi:hypothetical protein
MVIPFTSITHDTMSENAKRAGREQEENFPARGP